MVKRALRRLSELLGFDQAQVLELEGSVQRLHKHCRHLSGKSVLKEGSSAMFQQAAIVVKFCLKGQKVEHPFKAEYHKVGAKAPQIPIDMAVKYALQRCGRDKCSV
eukprot:TRINITY_DN15744_c0_g1_i1.p1 TRINITY_DN15744_c0_g1~~TRINITY_DN15744_c0_g1_i1.p1  ORF type:complete len:106 (-),score=24.39 TRINITY_DN15744_c0_g1_i1:95-412(-)